MNISVAVIVGAVIIGGSLLLAGERLADRMAQDSRCAGYLASAKGGEALFVFSVLEMKRGDRLAKAAMAGADSEESKLVLEEDSQMSRDARTYLQGLRLAGCRVSPNS